MFWCISRILSNQNVRTLLKLITHFSGFYQEKAVLFKGLDTHMKILTTFSCISRMLSEQNVYSSGTHFFGFYQEKAVLFKGLDTHMKTLIRCFRAFPECCLSKM